MSSKPILNKTENWKYDTSVFSFGEDGSIRGNGTITDKEKTTAISEKFVVDKNYITFFLSLTGWDGETNFSLYVEDKEKFFYTCSICGNGNRQYLLDMRDCLGKTAYISLSCVGAFESLKLYDICMTDQYVCDAKQIYANDLCDTLDCTVCVKGGKYINIPIDVTGAGESCNFLYDGQPQYNLYLRLAKCGRTDLVASIPIEDSSVENVRIYSENIRIPKEFAKGFYEQITVTDYPIGHECFYQEKGRPKLHFTPPYGGNGDMVGFYKYQGEYRIGYLYDPGFNCWNANASWACSKSKDLFTWYGHQMTIRKGFYTKATSGCAYVDTRNVSGLKNGEDDPIFLFYSVEKQLGQRYQDFSTNGDEKCIKQYRSEVSAVYSTDGGKTFCPYQKNPLFLSNGVGGHDPEVFYYSPDDKYMMVIHDRRNGRWGFDFYESQNLLEWNYVSTMPGNWETPNMYPLKDESGQVYWVLQQCDYSYYVGQFDGKEFHPKTEKIRNFHGSFAMRTFPTADGGRILMGNMGSKIFYPEGYKTSGAATLPMELQLKNAKGGMRVFYQPVKEIENLYREEIHHTNISADKWNSLEVTYGLLDIELQMNESFSINAGEKELVSYNSEEKTFKIAGYTGENSSEALKIRLIFDGQIISFFIEDGYFAGCAVMDSPVDGEPSLRIKQADHISNIIVRKLSSPYQLYND